MSNAFLLWAVPVSIALHNAEEAIWLPAWSQKKAGRWHRPVKPWSFRFAVSVLTMIVFLVAAWAYVGAKGSLGYYLLASFALGQAMNVFIPHVIASVATRTYAPGLLTGLLIVLPSACAFLSRSFSAGRLEVGRFLIVSACFIPAVLLSIPVLFRIGGRLEALMDTHCLCREAVHTPRDEPRKKRSVMVSYPQSNSIEIPTDFKETP